jgi:carbon-monoxide dehydrogenase medium subunit
MPRRIREYHRPPDWITASELLRRTDARAALLVLGPRPPLPEENESDAVVDLSQLNLAYITEDINRVVHVGALTSLQDLAEAPLLKSLANGLLAEAAHLAAHLGLRHVATLGGALLARAGPPEIPLALLVLDALAVTRTEPGARETVEVHVADLAPQTVRLTPEADDATSHLREIPLPGFQPNALALGEVLVEVKFDHPVRAGGALERLARTPRDQAIVAVAAMVEAEEDKITRARLAFAGGNQPQRLPSAEKRLEGQSFTDRLAQDVARLVEAEVSPASDFRASADYRRAVAGVLAQRALERARMSGNH